MGATNTVYSAKTPSAKVGGTAHGTTETQFTDATSAAAPLKVYIPGSSRLDGKTFRVIVSGRATGGTTVNLTIKLYYGVDATYSNNTSVYSTSTVAYNSASSNFHHVFHFVVDSTSKQLNGALIGGWNGTTPTIVTNAVTTAATSVDITSETLGFTLTGTWSGSNASNAAYITQFLLEQV